MANDLKNPISLAELVAAYSQSLGTEGAKKTVSESVAECGLPSRDSYSFEEALKIFQVLKSKPGLIGILSRCIENGFKLKHFIAEKPLLS